MAFWSGFADLVYPPRCLLCLRPPRLSRDHFCEACATSLFHDPHLACPRCAATVGPFAVQDGGCGVCRREKPAFDAAIRLGLYEGVLQQAVLRMKNATHEGLAELMGERWAQREKDRFRSLGIDAVVPVPLHWWRRFVRGYNQSGALAFGLAKGLHLPLRRWCLRRSRNTPSQKALTAAERRLNVQGAFAARARSFLAGQHVLLVDDVMTTGATASEAARELKRGGVARVTVAVLARADGKGST